MWSKNNKKYPHNLAFWLKKRGEEWFKLNHIESWKMMQKLKTKKHVQKKAL